MTIKCSKCYGNLWDDYRRCSSCASCFHIDCVLSYRESSGNERYEQIARYWTCPNCSKKNYTSSFGIKSDNLFSLKGISPTFLSLAMLLLIGISALIFDASLFGYIINKGIDLYFFRFRVILIAFIIFLSINLIICILLIYFKKKGKSFYFSRRNIWYGFWGLGYWGIFALILLSVEVSLWP